MSFHVLVALTCKQIVSEDDVEAKEYPEGIQVVRSIIGNEEEEPNGLRRIAGLRFASRQYGYLELDDEEEYLFVDEFNDDGMVGTLYTIRLDDFRVLGTYTTHDYFRDRAYDGKANQLLVAHYRFGNKITVHSVPDLEEKGAMEKLFPVRGEFAGSRGSATVQNVRLLSEARVLGTNEQEGWFKIIKRLNSGYRVLKETWIPTFTQEIDLDRSRRILAVASVAGYTLVTLDLDELEVLNKRIASFASWGVAIDPGRGRVFLTRVLLGGSTDLQGRFLGDDHKSGTGAWTQGRTLCSGERSDRGGQLLQWEALFH